MLLSSAAFPGKGITHYAIQNRPLRRKGLEYLRKQQKPTPKIFQRGPQYVTYIAIISS